MRRNLILTSTGNNNAGVARAVEWLSKEAAVGGGNGLIAVPTFQVLLNVFGDAHGKLLKNGVMVRGAMIQSMSEQNPLFDFPGPVLALYPTPKLLDRLDDMLSVTHLLVIPWLEKDVRDWKRAWSPTELGATPGKQDLPTISDGVVWAALNELTIRINMGTGILHPLDKQAAIETFRTLRLNGRPYDPDEIRAWLVGAKGMDPKDANAVRDLAQKILEGRTVQGAGPAKKNVTTYKRWVEESRSS